MLEKEMIWERYFLPKHHKNMNEFSWNRKQLSQPVDSILFRILVLICVLLSAIPVLWFTERQQLIPMFMITFCCAYVISYFTRKGGKWYISALKVVLAAVMIVNLLKFLENFLIDAYGPLGAVSIFMLWLQLIHSFDLPTKRDLDYSILVSFVLICTGAFFTTTETYGIYLLIYLIPVLCSLYYSSFIQTKLLATEKQQVPSLIGIIGVSSALAAITLLASIAVFAGLPKFNNANINMFSLSDLNMLSILKKMPASIQEEFAKKARSSNFKDIKTRNNDDYFGFSKVMDLNWRGKLSNEVVMRVKSPSQLYYKGATFTTYDGKQWIAPQEEPKEYAPPDGKIIFFHNNTTDKKAMQVFNIEKDMSNIIFGALDVSEIYFPGNQIYVDSNKTLISPYFLEKGMIYSCISVIEDNRVNQPLTEQDRIKYLQLPEISPRVKEYALKFSENTLSKEQRSVYQTSFLISEAIKEGCKYNLEVRKFPDESETTDYFLFETKEGFCEHFATAMAVVCRINDIPCRLVTGFVPSSYSRFSGYYEIRESDAHAWVEVYTKDRGWVLFDPTPGYDSTPPLLKNTKSIDYAKLSKMVIDFVMGADIIIDKIARNGGRIAAVFLIAVILLFFLYRYIRNNKDFFYNLLQFIMRFLHNLFYKSNFQKNLRLMDPSRQKIILQTKKYFSSLERTCGKRNESETYLEFINRCELDDNFKEKLTEFITSYYNLRYGDIPKKDSIDNFEKILSATEKQTKILAGQFKQL